VWTCKVMSWARQMKRNARGSWSWAKEEFTACCKPSYHLDWANSIRSSSIDNHKKGNRKEGF
jgi:hypothetical protein